MSPAALRACGVVTAGAAVAAAAAVLAAAGLEAPRREAGALLRAVAEVDVRLDAERPLPRRAVTAYLRAVRRRAHREPFAYVVGVREFWGLTLWVPRGVFIPRPESELLVEHALRLLPAGGLACDLCTGSGAVALALAHACPQARCDAGDRSRVAVRVAAANARRLGLERRVAIGRGDLFSALPSTRRGLYDVCTCNPPYVEAAEVNALDPEVRHWEPRQALVPAEGWRRLYRRLAAGAVAWLRPGGWLLCEVAAGRADEVSCILRAAGMEALSVHADLAGVPRVVQARRP